MTSRIERATEVLVLFTPVRASAAEYLSNGAESIGVHAPPRPFSALLPNEQSSFEKHSRVVRNRRLTLSERSLEVARTHLSLGRDNREQTESNRIGECVKHPAELGCLVLAKWCIDERTTAERVL
jgi:hypothetical protein